MNYSVNEVLQFVSEEDVKFIRLAFCDVFGRPKNLSIMPSELPRAFSEGIPFEAKEVRGLSSAGDLFLVPDSSTLTFLPWRPEHGRVVRMFCSLKAADGSIFENDSRRILQKAELKAADYGFNIGSESEFYLFKTDEHGNPTSEPHDCAEYFDMAPDDKGEDVRREICLTLEQMGIRVLGSYHEEGPGQNQIDFKENSPVSGADDIITFRTVVKTIAARSGLYADFSPKPMPHKPGSGFFLDLKTRAELSEHAAAGIIEHIADMTVFLNTSEQSYLRFGKCGAPKNTDWSRENTSSLLRLKPDGVCLRSPDSLCNPYIACALLIYAALDGIERKSRLLPKYDSTLPLCIDDAKRLAGQSGFIAGCLPHDVIAEYCR